MSEPSPLPPYFVHPTAELEPGAQVGAGTRIWRQAHIRHHAHIGEQCNIGKGVFVDTDVRIGGRVKIQNHTSVFADITLQDGVLVGPHVCFTNGLFPRAITPTDGLKTGDGWQVTTTLVCYGASLAGGSVIRYGATIGQFALVGADRS